MNGTYRRFPKSNSILTLGVLVLAGAVITTLAHAEERLALRYLSAEPLPLQYSAPNRNHWLLPAGVQGRLEVGDYYHMSFPGTDPEAAEQIQPLRLRLRLGGNEQPPGFGRSGSDRAFLSDSEREQQRLDGPLFSMSVSRSW